jgi:hypothetical protein
VKHNPACKDKRGPCHLSVAALEIKNENWILKKADEHSSNFSGQSSAAVHSGTHAF